MKLSITVETNHKPVYCRECRSQNTFERYPATDIKTESGRTFLLRWQCRICGKTCLTTNRENKVR